MIGFLQSPQLGSQKEYKQPKKDLKYLTCGYNQGNWCENKSRCKYKAPTYTEPDEITGKQKRDGNYMCSQGDYYTDPFEDE